MAGTTYIIYLDDAHLGDPLFLQRLGQTLAPVQMSAPPCLMIHGSGERAERLLEGEGLLPERKGGVLQVASPREAALVERATRELNRKLVGILTDQVVATVGIQGVDRSLLRVERDGTIGVGTLGWVTALMQQHIVPIISALAQDVDGGPVREVDAVEVTLRIAEALGEGAPVVVFFLEGNHSTLTRQETRQSTITLAELSNEDVPEPEAVRRVVEAGASVLLTSPPGLFCDSRSVGTRVVK